MITVTDNAKKQALRLMEDEGKDGLFIRVGVQGGGCSGLMYQLTFDNQDLEGDKSFEDNGIKVVVDKKSYLYLIGTTLDFSGGLNGKGFVFQNPNADRTCGCGERTAASTARLVVDHLPSAAAGPAGSTSPLGTPSGYASGPPRRLLQGTDLLPLIHRSILEQT
jgi:iron-sulfur cluster assembly protein